MRVVLDSNILARAAHNPVGPAGEIVERLKDPGHVLILSVFILDELDRVLRYPRLKQLHGLTDQEIDEYVQALADAALVIPITSPVDRIVLSDPDDDAVISTAEAGQAGILCTLDRHLHKRSVLEYCHAKGIEVLDDLELLRRLRV